MSARLPSGGPLTRWTLRAAWAILTAWSVCLWVLAGGAFGFCWDGMVEAAAVELAAVAVALALPDRLGRLALALTVRPRPGGLGSPPSVPTGRLVRLLAGAMAACAAGGLLTTAGTCLAPSLLRWLGGQFLCPAWTWRLVCLLIQAALFLPLAVAAAGLARTGALLCHWGPSDPYRFLSRDLMASLAAGLLLSAGLWGAGANLLGVAMGCAAALAGLSAASVARRVRGTQALPAGAPAAAPQGGQRRWNVLVLAALAWWLTLQCRALRDGAGCGWAGTWLWVSASAGIAAIVTRRLERRVRAGGAVEAASAGAGAMVMAAMQVALLGLAATGGGGRWVWVSLAGAGLIPFSALSATVLSRRRRLSARSGRSGRLWLADAAAGSAAGALAATWMLSGAGGLAVAAAGGGGLIAVFLAGAGAVSRAPARGAGGGRARRIRWAGAGAAAALSMTAVWAGLAGAARGTFNRPVVVGGWLSACQVGPAVVALPAGPAAPPGGGLDGPVRALIRSRPGRWWVVSAGDAGLLVGLGEGVRAQAFCPDPALGELPAWRGTRPAAFGRSLLIQTGRLDGVFLSGLRADHPDAWCLYSRQVLAACVERVAPGGLVVLRVAVGADGLGGLLDVARTLERAAGGGLAAVAVRADRVEALLAARVGAPEAAGELAALLSVPGRGAAVVRLGELAPPGPGGREVTALAPGRRSRSAVSLTGLAHWLERRGR